MRRGQAECPSQEERPRGSSSTDPKDPRHLNSPGVTGIFNGSKVWPPKVPEGVTHAPERSFSYLHKFILVEVDVLAQPLQQPGGRRGRGEHAPLQQQQQRQETGGLSTVDRTFRVSAGSGLLTFQVPWEAVTQHWVTIQVSWSKILSGGRSRSALSPVFPQMLRFQSSRILTRQKPSYRLVSKAWDSADSCDMMALGSART